MNNTKIKSETLVCQKKDVYLTELDEDRVMMDIETGNYYILNSMGSIIWDKIAEKISVGQLVQQLLEEYEVESDNCKTQVISYLTELQNINLVTIEN